MGREAIGRHRAALLAAADALDAILAPAQCPQLVQAIIQVGRLGGAAYWCLAHWLGWRTGWVGGLTAAQRMCRARLHTQTLAAPGTAPTTEVHHALT